MAMSFKRGVVLGLSSLLAVSGASATPRGANEVKGALEARSAERITVAGVSCTPGAQTKIEGNPQVGDRVELKYLSSDCLKLEREDAGKDSSNSKGRSQRSSAKLSPIATPAPDSSSSKGKKEGGTVAVKRSGGKIHVDITGKIRAAETSVVMANLGSEGCPVGLKGKRKGHDHSSNSSSSSSRLRTFELKARVGGTKDKVKPSGCAFIPDFAAGGDVTISVDGAVRLRGTLAALPTPTPSATPTATPAP